jgi:hypothetical protein
MKVHVTQYSFSASLRQVTFLGYSSINLENILLISNVTKNIFIYNFADANAGGTVSGNVLTLAYNTSSMSDSDKLLIYYDNDSTPSSDESNALLRRIIKLLESQATVDASNRQKVVVDGFNGGANGYANTVGVTSPGDAGGCLANNGNLAYNVSPNPFAIGLTRFVNIFEGPVDQRWRIINESRAAYAVGIRNNLIFS